MYGYKLKLKNKINLLVRTCVRNNRFLFKAFVDQAVASAYEPLQVETYNKHKSLVIVARL